MDIKSLLELSCAKVASLIKGMTIPETRKFFNIENDFSPEEEAQIMDENKWAEESFWRPIPLSYKICAIAIFIICLYAWSYSLNHISQFIARVL